MLCMNKLSTQKNIYDPYTGNWYDSTGVIKRGKVTKGIIKKCFFVFEKENILFS